MERETKLTLGTSLLIVVIWGTIISWMFVCTSNDLKERICIIESKVKEAEIRGYERGKREVMSEAVKNGVAYWTSNGNGNPLFVWGVKEK